MPLRPASSDAERARLHEAAQALESLVLKQIVTASKAFTGGEGPGNAVRADLFADALADAMVKGGGIGLAAQIERSLGGGPVGGLRSHSPSSSASPSPSTSSTAPAEPSQSRLSPPWSRQSRPGSTLSPPSGEREVHGGATSLADALFAASPTPARLTSSFGLREDPFTHREGHHGGVDLAEPEGQPVHAVLAGVVRAAGERGGYGNAVEIDHGGGVTTLYAHASELLVRAGDHVTPGQAIARVGHSGHATGDHLHFEVRVSGRQVDPIRALKIYARRADDPSESGS